jgi:1,4-alpha-glucan branching enzyme
VVTIGADGYAEFCFFRPQACNVFLVGDFNEWRTDQLRMVRQEDGHWVLKLFLPPGDYKFRYVADGLWHTDFAAFGVEPGRFGYNSLLLVPQRRLKLQPQPEVRPAAAAA